MEQPTKYKTPRDDMFDASATCWCSQSPVKGIYHRCNYLGGRMGAYINGQTVFRGDDDDIAQ